MYRSTFSKSTLVIDNLIDNLPVDEQFKSDTFHFGDMLT